MDDMFYKVTTTNSENLTNAQQYFARYENGYAFQSRQVRDFLEVHPNWKVTYDHEDINHDKGTYDRFIILSNRFGKSVTKATVHLESVRMADNLVELYPQHYLESDYPKIKK